MFSTVSNFLNNSSLLNKASLGLCAVASFEMGCRTIMNLNVIKTSEEDTTQARKDLSADLSGTFLFGLAAANLFPGTRKVAAIAFIIRSFVTFLSKPDEEYRQQEYWVGRVITFFPDQAYQGYQWVKSQLKLPSHPSWYLLIGLVALVGYYQFGGKVTSYFSGNN
ncbi:MAG: hypothetical protein KFB93_07355 [Simkaniaceae bacterium]|nr:MAG: hypothetical protein KFB93_07355 [Simkaniaceae bacterium]